MAKTDVDFDSIRRLASGLRIAAYVVAVAAPTATLLVWLLSDPAGLAERAGVTIMNDLSTPMRAVAVAAAVAGPLCLTVAFFRLAAAFRAIATGAVFVRPTVQALRDFGGWMLAFALVSVATRPAISLALTAANPPGERQLQLALHSDQFLTALLALSVWVIAAALERAVRLADELAEVI